MFEPRTTRNTRTIYSRKRLRLIKPSHGASVSFRDSYQIFVFPAKNWPQENTRNIKKRICISAHFAFLCGSHLWLRRQLPRVHSRSFAVRNQTATAANAASTFVFRPKSLRICASAERNAFGHGHGVELAEMVSSTSRIRTNVTEAGPHDKIAVGR